MECVTQYRANQFWRNWWGWLIFSMSLLVGPVIAHPNVECSKSSLEQRSCHLHHKKLELTLNREKILINDGTWRAVEGMPLVGDKVQWQQVRLRSIAGRYFIEFKIWDEPKTDLQVQSLVWILMEFEGLELKERVREAIAKRRQLADGTYLVDRPEPTKVDAVQGGALRWLAGRKSGKL